MYISFYYSTFIGIFCQWTACNCRKSAGICRRSQELDDEKFYKISNISSKIYLKSKEAPGCPGPALRWRCTMFDILMEEKVLTALMLSFLVLSIFIRIFLGLLYQKMIREADNMAATNNKMLKQCKLKFANCYQLSNGVANIPIFVDKFLNRLSFGHLSFSMMYHLSGQTMLLSVVFSGVGICKSIVRGRTLGDILPFYIVSFLGLYLYFSVSTVVDIKGRKRVLKVNLVDYLENHLSPRIDVTRQDIEMLYGEEIFDSSPGVTKHLSDTKGSRRGRINPPISVKRGKKTVDLMPINGRLTSEEKRDLLAVAEHFSEYGEEAGRNRQNQETVGDRTNQAPATEEELEELLREFLAL